MTRDVGAVTMDVHGVETRIDVDPLGGSDTVTVNDLHRDRCQQGQHRPGGFAKAAATVRATRS